MPEPSTPQKIAEMHAEYVRLTGLRLPLTPDRERAWYEWLKIDLTIDDLRGLIAQRRERIKHGQLTPFALTFRIVVGDLERSEEDIAVLRAAREKKREMDRRPAPPNLRMPLAGGQRPAAPEPQARSAADILKESEALKQFQQFKDTL